MSLDKTKISYELKVIKKTKETPDTVSIVLEIPEALQEKFKYKAGQFVTFILDLPDGEIRRSYSLASSPEYDDEFKVAVKLVPGGKGSTYLVQELKVGDKLWTTPPAGAFCLPNHLESHKLGFFAAGSGITPIISLIKSALKTSEQNECYLLYQNKTEEGTIFNDELQKLQREFAPRFTADLIFSASTNSLHQLTGRTNRQVISEFLNRHQLSLRSTYFVCGPEGFMDNVESSLYELGVSKNFIMRESFTVSSKPTASENKAGADLTTSTFEIHEDDILIGDRSQLAPPETIEAILDGETHTIPYKKDATVLECLLDAELNPPYSCLDGACMACIAKVEEGLVYQNDMGILTDDNIQIKECLTCQARPASKKVKVNYDS